ncbi:pentatricopeptide repeat-containing protein At3g58590-like [Oryza glaberrima]|uniref:Pentacotripeptide-repeat region of PRORP domain-containing protein n=2 Tax=Oryza TaxID=4527 RepID=A0A0D3EU42_9ORYZ|nr:pentatricopeptide repeat-containing protein At3g58590-like [Oryza glaberrima]
MPSPSPSAPPSASLFNSLIASRARAGRAAEGFALLARMLAAGVAPTAFTFAPILSSPSADARCAAQLHPHILKSGLLHSDPYSGTSLVGFFGRNGRFDDALRLFGEMPVRSVVTWNCLISSFAQHGRACDAVIWFRALVRSGNSVSDGSLVAVLPAFGTPEQVHGLVKKIAIDSFSTVANSLLNSYCTHSSTSLAENLFSEFMFRDVVSWNTMIIAFARRSLPQRALEFFWMMEGWSVLPNEITFSSVIYACTSIKGHEHGKSIHAKVIKHNLNTRPFVNTSLFDFYSKCGCTKDAHKVLEASEDSTTRWNGLISCHSDTDVPTSFFILREMLRSGVMPNEVSLSSLLKDPSVFDLLQIHSLVTRLGYDGYDYVSSAIISSYASHEMVSDALAYGGMLDPDSCAVSMNVLAGVYNRVRMYDEAKKLLLHQGCNDTVSWSILITACARNGDYAEALKFFELMRILGHHFDSYVSVSLLSICTKSNSLVLGRLLHGLIIKTNSGCLDTYVHNMLLDMYAKCGRIEECLKAFKEMEDRNIISWTAIISGLALNGFSRKALAWFKAMEEDGFKPDKVAITAVLSACRHGGLVHEGMNIFRHMKSEYSIEPEMEHYICVVDMLCKCGHLKEAEVVIRGMPFQPSAVVWRTFLQGCQTYGMIDTQVLS